MQLDQLCQVLTEKGFAANCHTGNVDVTGVNTLEDARPGEITFLANPKYASMLASTKASAVIVRPDVDVPDQLAAVRCTDPYAGITVAIVALHGYRQHPQWGIAPSAEVHESASVGANANIGPHTTVSTDAVIGDNCTLYPGSYVGCGARLGNDCVLHPNVVIYDHSILGDRVTVHAGSVIGEDGLGYAPVGPKWLKIPQVGRAILGNDVEIGANCTIDRATLGATRIGDGTKFGNVIVIGHGSKVGPDCLLVGLVGVAGSTTIGRHATIAGHVGVNGHCTLGDNVTVGGMSAVMGDVAPDATILGIPATDARDARRALGTIKKLPDLIQRIRTLERQVETLTKQDNKE